MSIILTKDTISKSVKKGIWYWTSKACFYRDIKKVCKNKYYNTNHDVKDIHIVWFNGLEDLFKNYQDNTSEYEIIYRTDIIENKLDNNLSDDELFSDFCKTFTTDKIFRFKDMFCSFSSCKDAAYYASTKNDKYSSTRTPQVTYVLKNRISKYFYIADFSQIPIEKEILYFGASSFIVVEQRILPENNIELLIVELETKSMDL